MDALFRACCELPIKPERLRSLMEEKHYSPKELTQTILHFVDSECFYDSYDFQKDHGREPVRGELSVHNLYGLLELFLEFGFDPNAIEDDENIMSLLGYIYNGYDAANCARLLMEHGGNPNLIVEDHSVCGWLSVRIDFDISEYGPDDLDDMIHLWFVFLGYGGRATDGQELIEMKNGHSVEELRTHEQFSYIVETLPEQDNKWIMHIIHKETGEEVAVF